MKRALIFIYVIILSLAAVPAAYPGGAPVAGAAGGQTWYLTDTPATASGADYEAPISSGTGGSDYSFSAGESITWAAALATAEQASNIVCRMSGSWSVTLEVTARANGNKVHVEVGYLSGGLFTSCGSSSSKALSVGTNNISVTTTSHDIIPGAYLAIRVVADSKTFTLDLTGPPSPSYATSPGTADDYPGTETISLTVTDNGATGGINFGSLNAGVTDQAEAEQNPPTLGAITLTVGVETNVDVSVQLKGDDFSGTATYYLSSADVQYDDDGTLDEGSETGKPQGTLTITYETWYSVTAHNSSVIQCYHWITVPSGQSGGSYTSIFYYQLVAQ